MIDTVLKQQTIRDHIYNIVAKCIPFDAIEEIHIKDTLNWIKSGAPIFRIAKPDIPNKHLVSYCVIFDAKSLKILLGDHKKAQLWVPPGGHVEINEHPKEAVKRECMEELYISADFWCEQPIFITSSVTVGLAAGHTDVSLWYVLNGDHKKQYEFNPEEFNEIRWFDFDEISILKTDPHIHRFINKLKKFIKFNYEFIIKN